MFYCVSSASCWLKPPRDLAGLHMIAAAQSSLKSQWKGKRVVKEQEGGRWATTRSWSSSCWLIVGKSVLSGILGSLLYRHRVVTNAIMSCHMYNLTFPKLIVFDKCRDVLAGVVLAVHFQEIFHIKRFSCCQSSRLFYCGEGVLEFLKRKQLVHFLLLTLVKCCKCESWLNL